MTENKSMITIPPDVQAKRDRWEASLAEQGLTWATFQEAVRRRIHEEKLPFVPAVFRVFEEFNEKESKAAGITLTCKKGCSRCCHVLLTSTEMEIDEVIAFINRMPRESRMPLVKTAVARSREWRDYRSKNEFRIRVEPALAYKEWQKPCPFLGEDGGCAVYPVRIVDCRTLTNLRTCNLPEKITFFGDIHADGPVRYRFLSENWATNLIMKNAQQKLGLSSLSQVPVTPVLQWLYEKRKELG